MRNESTRTMSEGSSSPKRARLDFDDNLKDDHYDKYKNRDHEDQGSYTHSRRKRGEPDDDDLKESDEVKAKSVAIDVARREHTLVMRLTNKEQELQECMNQIQEMKQAQTQNTAQLRSMLLDPAINLVFQRMAREMDEHKEKLKQKQNELSAWKFTPDSQTGMRLMAKCRMLLQENGELGKMISSGRTARLEGEITLQKALVTEMKTNQKELDEFVGELEEDVESMQGMILMLQQQLKEAREQISRLQQENELLRTSQIPVEPGGLTAGIREEPSSNATSTSTSQPTTSQVNSLTAPITHQSTPLSGGSNDSKEMSSLLKASGETANPVDATTAGSLIDFPLTATQTSPYNPSPPAFKFTPDSGMQTQEEDNTSMDTADFVSARGEDTPKQIASNSAESDQVAEAVGSEKTAPVSKSPVPTTMQDDKSSVRSSPGLELEHNAGKISSSLDVSNSHPAENVRTSPSEDNDANGVLRTNTVANASHKNSSSNVSLSERTTTLAPPNGDELTVESSSDNNHLDRTSVGDSEEGALPSIDDDKKKDEASRHSECGVVSVAGKVEGESSLECVFHLGLTNGSSDSVEGPDL